MLSKDKGDYLECYKCAWLNKPIPNIQEWREENDGEYLVLTDGEADRQANEYLTDDTYLWTSAVEQGYTREGIDEIVASVKVTGLA